MRGEERLKQSSFVDELVGFLRRKSSIKEREGKGMGSMYGC